MRLTRIVGPAGAAILAACAAISIAAPAASATATFTLCTPLSAGKGPVSDGVVLGILKCVDGPLSAYQAEITTYTTGLNGELAPPG
jgi:hypothetical protein